MSSENEKESIKLQLLGVQDSESESSNTGTPPAADDQSQAEREKVRKEILARRQRYLAAKRTQPIYKPKRRRWGAAPIVLLALAGITIGAGWAVRNATATQEKKNQAYAVRMLDAVERFDLQDLAALNSIAAEAEDLLPDASMLGLASEDWDRLYLASRAARCLFTARMGNVELAIEQIEATQKIADRIVGQGNASQSRLVANLCVGKAGVAVCELLANSGRQRQAAPYGITTLETLNDAYVGLHQSTEISPDSLAVLAAGLQLDMGRLRSRGINPLNMTQDQANVEINRHGSLAREHLESVQNRGGGWWNQQLRLQAQDLLIQKRVIVRSRIETPEIRRLLSTVDELDGQVSPVISSEPKFATSLNYHFAIYISNLLDLVSTSVKDDQRDEFGPQLIDLRRQVIERLHRVPVCDRTHLHHTNLRINYARRMETSCQMAVFAAQNGEDPSEHLVSAKLDARSLESTTGKLLAGKRSQLSTTREILAAILIGSASDGEIQQYAERYPPFPPDQSLVDSIRVLLQ